MNDDSYKRANASAGSPYPMVAIASVFRERSEKADAADVAPLSVGKLGVTEQLESVATSADTSSRKLVRKGDLVINSRSDRRGAAGLAPRDGTVSMVYTVLKPNPDFLDPWFAHHLLRSSGFSDEFFRWGTGIVDDLWSTNSTRMGRIRIPLPPLDHQRRIADYLDCEIAEMDAMNADLDKLIETLSGRRLAEMIDALTSSQRTPVALMAEVQLGKMLRTSPSSSADMERPYMRAAHVQPLGVLDLTVEPNTMWFTPAEAVSLDLRRGDVVVVEGGVGGYGRAAFVHEDIPGWGFQNSIVRLRAEHEITGKYLAYALVAARGNGEIAVACESATMPHFTAEKVSRFRVPFHTIDEQHRIVAQLQEATSRINAMIGDAERLKTLLAERRSTLITEIVTGRKEVPAA